MPGVPKGGYSVELLGAKTEIPDKQGFMTVATKTPFAILFLMVLALSLPLALPPEDVAETAYDESETLPYEVTPLASIAVPSIATRTAQEGLSFSHLKPGAPSVFAAAPVCGADANRSAEARGSLSLLCTLRC